MTNKKMKWVVLVLPLILVAKATFADECSGPFVTEKYPVAHLVVLDKTTRCYRQWTAADTSPEDVRCAFSIAFQIPATAPEKAFRLSPENFQAYLDQVQLGSVNLVGGSPELMWYAGFRSALTPADSGEGC